MAAIHLLALCLLFPLSSLATGVADTIVVDKKFRLHHFPPGILYFESANASADSALSAFKAGHPSIKTLTDPNIGIVSNNFWFWICLKNTDTIKKDLILAIRHPHLRRIIFYRVEKGKISHQYETGYTKPFVDREISHRFFINKLNIGPGETAEVMILVDHENSLDLPITLYDQHYFFLEDARINLFFGIGMGLVLFCSLFAVLGALILRTKLFLWYSLYLLAAFLYAFTDLGFSAQFLYPTIPEIDGPLSIHTSLYPFIFLIKFSQALLNTRFHHQKFHRVLNIIFAFLLFMVAADAILGNQLRQYAIYFLPVVFLVILCGLILLGMTGIRSLRYNRPVATLYLLGSGMVIITGCVAIVSLVFGLSGHLPINPVLIGYCAEIIFLSAALLVQYRNLQQEKLTLTTKVAEQQQEIYVRYIEGIERERSRIAGDLHDDIGSKLSHLKREIEQAPQKSAKTIDQIIEDVRQLSHDLAVPSAANTSLLSLVETLIAKTRKLSGIDIRLQTFDYQERLTSATVQQIYRIMQESIHNIIKHSKATRADVQFFGYPSELVITIEDNGTGFNIDHARGLGLIQMQTRAKAIDARLDVSSHPESGCVITLVIPWYSSSWIGTTESKF
jgi:signal transduction histidine kinase